MDSPSWSDTAERVHQVLDYGDRVSYSELAHRLNLSERQLRRGIRELRAFGVPVRAEGRPAAFTLDVPFRRERTFSTVLRADEALALALSAQISRAVLSCTPLGEALAAATGRILASSRSTSVTADVDSIERQWYFADAPSAPIASDVFEIVRESIDERRSVTVDYYSAHSGRRSTQRKLDPYCIAMRSGSWILVAWCHDRREIREFNLVDLSRVTPCDPSKDARTFFEPLEDFDPELYFRDRFRLLGGDGVRVVELLVEPSHVVYFRRKNYHPTQQVEYRADGRAIVSYEVDGLDDIRSFAQSWGPAVTVVAPAELVEIMCRDAIELAERYRTTVHSSAVVDRGLQ